MLLSDLYCVIFHTLIIIIIIIILIDFRGTAFPEAFKNYEELCVSRLVMSHFNINIAEQMDEADCIKALDSNRKALA